MIDIVPGISGRLAEMPPLPEALEALSQYIEFDAESLNTRATIGLPPKGPVEDTSDLGCDSYEKRRVAAAGCGSARGAGRYDG